MKERISIQPDKSLRYIYTTSDGEMSFRFSMLCEVGEPYQPRFLDTIAEEGHVMMKHTGWTFTPSRRSSRKFQKCCPRFFQNGSYR